MWGQLRHPPCHKGISIANAMLSCLILCNICYIFTLCFIKNPVSLSEWYFEERISFLDFAKEIFYETIVWIL